VGRDSAIGTTNCYKLEGPKIPSVCVCVGGGGARFSAPIQVVAGAPPAPPRAPGGGGGGGGRPPRLSAPIQIVPGAHPASYKIGKESLCRG
jgi:hypothetical protein